MSRYEMPKVEVQKGPIVAHQPTMKTKTHRENAAEEVKMMNERRDGQFLKMHKPK